MNIRKKLRAKKLIRHQMLEIGAELIHQTRPKEGPRKILNATVIDITPGIKKGSKSHIFIRYDGKIYQSISAAARAASGYTVDGWDYWKIQK